MRFIDTHLHTEKINPKQLQKLAMMGMEACVIASPHMFIGTHSADTLLLLWERFLTLETTSAKTLGFEAFTSIGIPFFGLNHADAERCLAKLPDFLKNERVVAMGELGMDTGTEFEEFLFREQLKIAKARNLPVILHTPIRFAPQGKTVLPRILEIIKEEGYPVEKAIFDHSAEDNIAFRLKTGGMVGLSICYDKMPPEVAAQYVIDNPNNRKKILINSEHGGDGNDYFMVPRVMLSMKMGGLDRHIIEDVCYTNPKEFFKLPLSN